MPAVKFIIHSLGLGVCYVALSLVIGDCHPFALQSMYNSFPTESCSFYLSDRKGNLLPLQQYYHYKTGDLTHNYYAVCDALNVEGGHKKETAEQLDSIGRQMLTMLQPHRFTDLPTDTVQLHQVYYFLQNDSITTDDRIMYEATWK